MKAIKKNWAPILGMVLGLAAFVKMGLHAQQASPGATPVQQQQPFYNCNQTQTATGAANTAVTVTFTPPAGQFLYICSIYIVTASNAAVTPAAGPAPIFTTTNLQNNLVWWGDNAGGCTSTACAAGVTGALVKVTDTVYPLLLKTAAAGTAFTLVTSAGQASESVRINVTGFFAP
jgi:hypothetical protein